MINDLGIILDFDFLKRKNVYLLLFLFYIINLFLEIMICLWFFYWCCDGEW